MLQIRLRRVSNLVFGLVACLLLSGNLIAASYFVDFTSGNDGNSGQSTSLPFQHCPGDSNAFSVARSTILTGGDVVNFKGGVEYRGEIQIPWAGSAGAPISYLGNYSGIWGEGLASINLASHYYHGFNAATPKDYITIQGFRIFNAKNANNLKNQTVDQGGTVVSGVNYEGNNFVTSIGVIFNFGGDYWEIRDCKIFNTENWSDRAIQDSETDGNPNSGAEVPANQAGINLYRGSYFQTVSNCSIWAIGRDCLRLWGGNMVIQNCNFGGDAEAGPNVGWFSVGVRLYGTNVLIQDCVFHDGWQYQGDDKGQRCHAGDWIHSYGNNNGIFERELDPNHNVVERCTFYCNHHFVWSNGTAYSFLEEDVFDVIWRNNLFLNSFSGGVEMGSVSNITFYANTFVDYSHSLGGGSPIDFFLVRDGPKNVTIKNNIFVTLSPNSSITGIGSTSAGIPNFPISDYNLFYQPNNGKRSVFWNGKSLSLAAWQAMSGNDLHSVFADPEFVNQPLSDTIVSTGDWTPKPTSPLVGAGYDLSAFLTTDFTGKTRSGTWDIGAIQVSSSPGVSATLNSPVDGAVLPALTTILCAGDFALNGHTLDKVQYYNGGTLLGESTSSPYSFDWSNVAEGSYLVTLRMIYDGGQYVSSPAARITVTNAPAATDGSKVFTMSAEITLPAIGTATPYPSAIEVSGTTGAISSVSVTLTGVSHAWSRDIAALLVGPNGQRVVLLAGVGSGPVTAADLVFSDNAPALAPRSAPLTAGKYRPSNFDPKFVFAAPAPAGPYGTALDGFLGGSPNGRWSLYVVDSRVNDQGSISGGWALTFQTGASALPLRPPPPTKLRVLH